MPKIPVISSPGVEPPSTLNAPRLSLNVPRSATGATAAENITKLGGDVAKVMGRVEARRDRVAVEKAYGAFYDELREVTHGADGFFTKRGDQVELGAAKKLEPDLAKLQNKNSKDLRGNRQQEEYARKVHAVVARTLDSAAKHEGAQLRVASAQANEADAGRIAEEARLDLAASADMEFIQSGADFIEAELRERGDADPDAIALARKTYVSGVLKSRIEALAEKNPALAKERFNQHDKQNRFMASDRDDLDKKLKSEVLKVNAQALTDEFWAQFKGDLGGALTAVRTQLEGDLEDDVVRRLTARAGEEKKQKIAAYDDFVSGVFREIDEAESLEEGYDIIDGYRSELEKTELGQARAFAGNVLGGKVKVTDQSARVGAMVRIDKKEFPKGEPGVAKIQAEYGESLTPADLAKVVDYHLKGGNVGGLKNSEAERWFVRYTYMKSTDRPEEYTKFWDALKEKLVPGEKPTADDIKTWAVEYLTTPGVIHQGSFFFFDAKGTRAEAIRSGDIEDFQPYTNEERDAAVALMRKHNAEYKDKQVDVNSTRDIERFVIMMVRK